MIGYGSKNLEVRWPNNARIALQIVLNYEEGAENNAFYMGIKLQKFFYQKL